MSHTKYTQEASSWRGCALLCWWDGSAGKGLCHQACLPEDPHGAKTETTSTSYPLTMCVPWNTCMHMHTYEQHHLPDWGCAPQLKKHVFYIRPLTISASQWYVFSSRDDASVLWALFRLCSFCGLICCTPKPWKPFLPSAKESPNFSCKFYCYLAISLTLAN